MGKRPAVDTANLSENLRGVVEVREALRHVGEMNVQRCTQNEAK